MFETFQIVVVLLVALVWATVVAHALELPGKMRLDKNNYFAVQRIYYPGFTIAGMAEFVAIIAIALLLFLTPPGTAAFWLVLVALAGMIVMDAIYWVVIHALNKYWVEGQAMGGLGGGFFGVGGAHEGAAPEWTDLRDRWEYAHVCRAAITTASFLALLISLRVQP